MNWFLFISQRETHWLFPYHYELIDLNMFWGVSIHCHYYLIKAQIILFLASGCLFHLAHGCYDRNLVDFGCLFSIFIDNIFWVYLVYFCLSPTISLFPRNQTLDYLMEGWISRLKSGYEGCLFILGWSLFLDILIKLICRQSWEMHKNIYH